MSYSQDLVDIMRSDLGGQDNLSEKEISGALCFLLKDKVLCGISGDCGFYHTGRWNEGEALALGSNFFVLEGSGLDGLVELDPGGFIDPARRMGLTELALTHVAGLNDQETE